MKPSPKFVAIGRIQRPHGLRGEVRVQALTDWPARFTSLSVVSVLKDGAHQRDLHIEKAAVHATTVLLKFRGIDDRSGAQALGGMILAIDREQCVKLPAGEFYVFDLIGLQVVDQKGREIGKLTDIVPHPANDVWVVRHSKKEWLIPATQDFVKRVDLEAGHIVVDRIDEFED